MKSNFILIILAAIVIIVSVILSCEDEGREVKKTFYVDEICTDLAMESFRKGVKTFNRTVGYKAIELKTGLVVDDYGKLKAGDGIRTIACPPNRSDYKKLIHHSAYCNSKDIFIDLSRLPGIGNNLLKTFLHELGHVAGAGHSTDPKDIMAPGWADPVPIEYTEHDKSLMTVYF